VGSSEAGVASLFEPLPAAKQIHELRYAASVNEARLVLLELRDAPVRGLSRSARQSGSVVIDQDH
jgi:hypothetical protein